MISGEWEPVPPVVRFSMQVGNRDDENLVIANLVDDPVGEAVKHKASSIGAEEMPGSRMAFDPLQRQTDCIAELCPESASLPVIVISSETQVVPRRREEADLHRSCSSAKTSSAEIACISPAS